MGKKKIHVVLLYCGVRTGHFGAGSHISNLLPAFKKAEEDFSLYIIKTDDKSAGTVYEDKEEGFSVLHIPQPENKLYLTVSQDLVQKTYAKRLVEIIYPFIKDKEHPIFLINSIDYLNIGVELKENLDCRLVYVHHAWTWKSIFNVPDEKFADLLKKGDYTGIEMAVDFVLFQQRIAMLADRVITFNHQARSFFMDILKIPPEKIYTIYNGIAPPTISKSPRSKIREKLGIGISEKIILFTGRIKEDKGLVYLIRSFGEVARKYPNSRLVLVGSGDFDQFIPLAYPISTKVTFTGKLEKEDLEDWYKIADIGILPSLHEQSGFTAIEMRFHKIPLIVSSVDGLDEMFIHGHDALKLSVQLDKEGKKTLDTAEIGEYIGRLLKDRDFAKQLAANGHKVAFKYFTAEKMQQDYLKVLKKLALGNKNKF